MKIPKFHKEVLCNLWPKISLKFWNSFEIFKSGYGIVSEILRNIYPCKILIISQLLIKTCNLILSAPMSWRHACAIHNLHTVLQLLCNLCIAQTCIHDLGADKMTLQVLLRSWKMMSILKTRTTTSLIFEKLSKMNCAVTAYSL